MTDTTLRRLSLPAAALAAGALLLVAAVVSAQHGDGPGTATPSPQVIVVNLKHYGDDLHAAFMGVKIATALQQAGAKVTIFANLEGVRLVDAATPDGLRWGANPTTIGEVYGAFTAAGGTVAVCPHCAEAAGLDAAGLRPGAAILTHDAVATLFLAADKVIDY